LAVTESPLRVLVVDDGARGRDSVLDLIKTAHPGFEVEAASDATEAMNAMRAGKFDVILLDLDHNPPDRDGTSLLRSAVAAGVTAPILVLTAGESDLQLTALLLRDGASDHMAKASLQDSDLPQRIRQVVRLARAQSEARRVQQSLQDRVEFEQQLIGVVSHDLRNPLSTIRLSAQVLRSKLKEEAQRNVLERIIRATGQADRMIRDLIDFTQARLGAGIPLEREVVDFHEVVRQVLGDLRVSYPDRDLRLEQTGDGTGSWDPGRLAQLAMNLVGNAYQHSQPGSPIQVTTAVEGSQAMLKISNSGPVIPPADLTRVFEPLRRGRSVNSSGTGNIGLGLFISQAIARAHGGDIEVVSNDRVTTFTVRLPTRAG
jgi:signal transduction histidine kinase